MIEHGLDYADLYPADYVSMLYKAKDGRQCQFFFKCDSESLCILDCRYHHDGMDAYVDLCEGLAIGVVGIVLSDVKQLNTEKVLPWFPTDPILEDLNLLLGIITAIVVD